MQFNFTELNCERKSEIIGIGTVESVDTKEPLGPVDVVESLIPPTPRLPAAATSTASPATSTHVSSTGSQVTSLATAASTTAGVHPSTLAPTISSPTSHRRLSSTTIAPAIQASGRPTSARTGNVVKMRTTVQPTRSNSNNNNNNNQEVQHVQQQQQQHQNTVFSYIIL